MAADEKDRSWDRSETLVSSGGGKSPAGAEVPQQRATRVMPAAKAPDKSGHPGQGDTRRIVGVLLTYSWLPYGQLFPVREGKNFIGRAQISSETEPRDCDVYLPQDERMSAEHAVILCRAGNYEIIDQMSSNGTFVDGKLLKANQSEDLRHYAQITTGSTSWTFIRTTAPHDVEQPPVQQPEPQPVEDEDLVVR